MKRYIMVHLKELLERYEIIPTYLIHIPTKFVLNRAARRTACRKWKFGITT